VAVDFAAAIAWLGLVAHNSLSLGLPLLAPENVGPLMVWGAVIGWHRLSHGAQPARIALMLWAGVNLVVGGVLSVVPLSIWPFVPEQTLDHYAAHVIYAGAQVPMLWLLRRRPGPAVA
jgi:hypothetical protein